MNYHNHFAFAACMWLFICVKLSSGECDTITVRGDAILGALVPAYDRATKCDRVSLRGVLMAEAILYSLNEVNNKRRLQSKTSLGVEIRDSCKQAFHSAFNFFVKSPKPLAVIANLPQDNVSNVQAIRLVDLMHIPYLSCNPSTYDNPRKQIQNADSVFHVQPTDKSNIAAILSFIASFNWTNVGVVADDGEMGNYSLKLFSKEAEKRNICVGGQFLFPSKPNQKEISTFIERLNSGANFSVVVLLSSKVLSESIIDSAYKQKLSGISWLAGQDSWEDAASVSKQNTAARGMFKIGTSAKVLPFKEHLRNLTNGPIKNTWLCQLLSAGWPAGWPTPATITGAPSNKSMNSSAPAPTPAAPTTASTAPASNTSQCDCASGIPAGASKDLVNDVINKLVAMAESEACLIDATFAFANAYAAKEDCKNGCPTFVKHVQDVSFSSSTGHQVSFDNQRYLKKKEFYFYNYQNQKPMTANERKNFKRVEVGTWRQSDGEESKLEMQPSRIKWNSGSIPQSRCEASCPPGKYLLFNPKRATDECCWQCTPCPEGTMNSKKDSMTCSNCEKHWRPNEDKTECTRFYEDYVHWDNPAALIMIFLMTAGVAFSFYVMVTMVRHNDTPVVKNARNAILFLLPFLMIMFLLPVPLLGRPTETTCEAYRGFFIIIIGTPLAVLIAKSHAVEQAFYDEDGQAKVNWRLCTPRFLIVLLLMVLHIIFAIVVATVLPVEVYRFPTDDPFVEYLECSSHSTFQILIAVLYVFVLAVIVSVLSLNELLTEENHSEVKWISMCMFNLYAITFFYLIFTFRLHAKGKIIALTFVCLLYAINYLGCIFIPKWYIIVFRPEQNLSDVSPFDVYQKSRDKISERLCHQEESPLAIRKGPNASTAKEGTIADERDPKSGESKQLMSDTDL